MRAASSTSAIARGNVRRSRGTSRPLSPVVAPYIAPSIAIFASERVATAPVSTMPAYRSFPRAASASAVSRAIAASTRGSSCATSATTSSQPGSARTAARSWRGICSAPPAGRRPSARHDARRGRRRGGTGRRGPTRPATTTRCADSSRESFLYSRSGSMTGCRCSASSHRLVDSDEHARAVQRSQELAAASPGSRRGRPARRAPCSPRSPASPVRRRPRAARRALPSGARS